MNNDQIGGFIIIVKNTNALLNIKTRFYQRARKLKDGHGRLTDMPLTTNNPGKAKRYKTRYGAEKAIERMANLRIVRENIVTIELGKISIEWEQLDKKE